MTRRSWSPAAVIAAIKARQAEGLPLSSDRVHYDDPPLMGAARRYYDSWSAALIAAGIDPATVRAPRNPRHRWSKAAIVRRIQEHAQAGHDLAAHRLAAIDAPVVSAAPKHFSGGWDEALRAAGYDPAEIRRTRTWSPERIADRIRELHRDRADLSDQSAQAYDGGFYGAAREHYGSWRAAVEAAGIDYSEVRRNREGWTREAMIHEIRRAADRGISAASYFLLLGAYPALMREFGSAEAAYEAAGVEPPDRGGGAVASRLREARKAAKLSQEQLGAMVGRSHRAIGLYESGEHALTLEMGLRLAKALGMRVEELFSLP
jgi:DNA-binding XRE family transcriptional regulator